VQPTGIYELPSSSSKSSSAKKSSSSSKARSSSKSNPKSSTSFSLRGSVAKTPKKASGSTHNSRALDEAEGFHSKTFAPTPSTARTLAPSPNAKTLAPSPSTHTLAPTPSVTHTLHPSAEANEDGYNSFNSYKTFAPTPTKSKSLAPTPTAFTTAPTPSAHTLSPTTDFTLSPTKKNVFQESIEYTYNPTPGNLHPTQKPVEEKALGLTVSVADSAIKGKGNNNKRGSSSESKKGEKEN